eukprot:SAG11_NODE_1110_length_5824_cov_7.340087_7_plen_37_part_00
MDLVQAGAYAMHAVERNSDNVSSIELSLDGEAPPTS